jgi:hypothetical protein
MRVRDDAATNKERARRLTFGRSLETINDLRDRSFLETCREICAARLTEILRTPHERRLRPATLWDAAHFVQEFRLEAREREIERIRKLWARELEGIGISSRRTTLEIRPTRMRKPEHHSRLVERFTDSVVNRAPKERRATGAFNPKEACMPAGNDETECRTRYRRRKMVVVRPAAEQARKEMRRHVVDRVKGPMERKGDRFGETRPNQQTADQSRANPRRDRIDLIDRHPRFVERLANNWQNALDVRATGDLGHDTAVLRMEFILRRDDARTDTETSVDDCSRRFVTRTFDAKDARHGRAW